MLASKLASVWLLHFLVCRCRTKVTTSKQDLALLDPKNKKCLLPFEDNSCQFTGWAHQPGRTVGKFKDFCNGGICNQGNKRRTTGCWRWSGDNLQNAYSICRGPGQAFDFYFWYITAVFLVSVSFVSALFVKLPVLLGFVFTRSRPVLLCQSPVPCVWCFVLLPLVI